MIKKHLFLLIVVLLCLVVVPVYAWQNGGATGSGGSTGSGTSSSNPVDAGSGFDSGAYLFQLVYKPQNGSYYQVGKCAVVITGTHKPSNLDIYSKANATASANGCSLKTGGSLTSLAKEIQSKGGLDNVRIVSDEEYAKQLVGEFNMTYDEMTLPGSTPGNINSYGYRILVQKLTCFGFGSRGSNVNNWCDHLWPRKSWAAQRPNYNLFGGSYQNDLYTTADDIGIHKATYTNWAPFAGQSGNSTIGRAFADLNRGEGYNIIGFDENVFSKPYDYSIDAACVNCNVTNTGNKAYIIQDTNDWDAIFASDDSTNKNIKSYYNKGNGVYCREEYTVYFPDNSDIFYVEPGRYFTLNASASALNKVSATATFPNFKPIKVVKKRVCRVNNGNTSALDAFRRKSESTFKGRTGTVSFKYNETYKDSRYNMSDAEELKAYDEPNNYKYSINGDTLTMEVTKNYTLPDNYYQYIRKQDGLSMKTKPSSNLNYYINVGISNLPVSFKNYGDSNGKAADVQFAFELPDDDGYSKLNKAYIKDNSYLKNEDSEGNIYKKYINNKMESGDQELLNNSACAKMYGVNTSGFQSCARNRTGNAIGDGSYNCISQNQLSLTGGTTKGYSCMVLMNPDGGNDDDDDNCNSEADAKNQGRDWNPVGKYCCPVGTHYDSTTGKCDPNNVPGDDCDSEADAKSQGRDWNPNGKYCCPVGSTYNPSTGKCEGGGGGNSDNVCRIENGKYYDFNGNEITKDEYDVICPSDVPYYCPESDCPYGCCPSGECAPMPDGTCPGSGGIDVIYRTIDLKNPFPGQNAENRETGANWCSYNIRTQQIDCKYNNQTVKNYITRERGGTVNGGKVYREDHVLYEVTLDTKTINSIRSYNDKNKYDDWDLQCLENGKACISDFLNSEVTTTGKCANVSRSNFYSCDKDV